MDGLEPFHEQAQRTAINLARSPEEGHDLFQETLLRAFEKQQTLRDETKFRSWFFAVLISVHRSRQRRRFWKRFSPLQEALTAIDPRSQNQEDLVRGHRRMSKALFRLPAEQREAVVLFELEGFSIADIAQIQDATPSCVKSRLSRGRQALADVYRRKGWVPGTRSLRSHLSQLAVVPVNGNQEGERHA